MKRLVPFLAALAVAACGPSVKTVSVDPARTVLDAKGGTASLQATGKDGDGKPVDLTKQKVAWSSSDAQIATVDAAGTVTAVKSGVTSIEAAVGAVKGSAQVIVAIPGSIAVTPGTRELRPEEAVVLTVVILDDAGKPVTTPRPVVWTSSDPAVATVTDGKVLAMGPGSATITAASGSLRTTAQVTVKVPDFAKLALNPAKGQTLKRGDTLRLKASALDKKGKAVGGVPVTWRSSDARVVTVAADGTVKAMKKGKAKVTAAAAGKSAAVQFTVTEPPPAKKKKK
jgi:uncharacterized protein YjdB